MIFGWLENVGIEHLASDPDDVYPGRFYYNTTDDVIKCYLEGAWQIIPWGDIQIDLSTNPTDTQVLSYNSSSGKYEPVTLGEALEDTDDLAEGASNLYFTDERVETVIDAYLPDTDALAEGVTNLYYTDVRVSANSDVAANTSARHTHSNKTELDKIASVPSGSATLVDTSTAQAITGKTIDSDNNTITNIVDADIKANAGISRSKIASGTASHVVINHTDGSLTSEATLAISRGGTGQSSANNALNALLPSQIGNSGKVLTTDGTDTSWENAGGAGSGEINVIDSDAAEWNLDNTLSNATITNETTVSNMPLGEAGGLCFTIDSDGSENIIRKIDLPEALRNMKLKIEIWPKWTTYGAVDLEMFSYSASDYSTGATQLVLSTDSAGATTLPNSNRKFVTYFDSTDRQYYALRFGGLGNAYEVSIQSAIVGPGIQPQGAVVSDWQNFTATIGSFTASSQTSMWRRVGDSIEVMVHAVSNTTVSGNITIALPNSLTIDTSKISTSSSEKLGTALAYDSNVATFFTGSVGYNGSTSILIYPGSGNGSQWNASSPMTWASSDRLEVHFFAPVSQWSGSGTANLAQNDVEYASNSSSTDADDTTSFVYGPAGSTGIIRTTSLTAQRKKRVRFPTPFQVGDSLELQLSNDGTLWVPYQNHGTYRPASGGITSIPQLANTTGAISTTNNVGVGYIYVNSTDVDVVFGRYVYISYAGDTVNWNDSDLVSGTKWRLVKVKSGQAVGFGQATSTSLGLVKGGTVPGLTSGVSISSGYVGERINSSAMTTTTRTDAAPTEVDVTGSSLVLTAGVWAIYWGATVLITSSGGSTTVAGRVRVTDSSNNVVTGSTACISKSIAGNFYNYLSNVSTVNISSSTTYKLRIDSYKDATSTQVSFIASDIGFGFSGNDNEAYFYAIRIA